MDSLLNLFMENFELILFVAVLVTGAAYVYEWKTSRKHLQQLEKRFLNNNETQEDRIEYAARLAECLRTTASEKMPENFHRAQSNLTNQKPLNRAELLWLRTPVFANERFIHNFSGSFWILFIIWFVRSFMFEPFRIPSGSMEPTLYAGDFILTNKSAFGVRFPITNTTLIPVGKVNRGDVAVFKYPKNPKINYIKRIIGLPGDEILIENGRVTINGEIVGIDSIKTNEKGVIAIENLPNQPHQVQFYPDRTQVGRMTLTVPEGHYFVMGDNRDGSEDSRSWGYVADKHLVGRAFFIWMNSNCIFGKGGCDRIGSVIR